MSFKIGDRVKCKIACGTATVAGRIYTVGNWYINTDGIRNEGNILYIRDDSTPNGNGCSCLDWWELVSPEEEKNKLTTMAKISNAIKKFLNADLQTQLKAGYRNGNLELTQEGKDVLLELLADTVTDKFVASANEKIAEEETKTA